MDNLINNIYVRQILAFDANLKYNNDTKTVHQGLQDAITGNSLKTEIFFNDKRKYAKTYDDNDIPYLNGFNNLQWVIKYKDAGNDPNDISKHMYGVDREQHPAYNTFEEYQDDVKYLNELYKNINDYTRTKLNM